MMNGGGSSEGEAADFDDSAEIVPGWIRIKLADDSEPLRTGVFTRGGFDSGDVWLDELAAGLGATEIRRVFRDGGRFEERHRRYGLHLWYDIRIADEVPVSRARAEMVSLPGVDVVEPVYRVRLAEAHVVPDISDRLYRPFSEGEARPEPAPFNDPELSRQWHYNNDGSIEGSVAGADINLFKAWREIGAGRPEVVVAVIDGGIQYDHPDLAANMWTNEAEMNGTPGVDDDGNGYVDDIYGWNYYTDSGTITQHFHGTHVAGTVAAVNNNGIGVCGVAGGTGVGDGVRLMSCQNYDTDANGQEVGSVTEESFIYAADNGAVIAQCSWGYNGIETPLSMQRAIQYFIREAGTDENGVQTGPMKGGVVCFSAGNSSYSHVGNPGDMEEVVGVTAMGPDYKKAGYSNYGSAADLFAPGGASSANPEDPKQVYSTYINGGYAYLWGTSMACPHVSGVAALIIAEYGQEGFTAEQCREILLRAYRPVGGLADDDAELGVLGVGLLDAGAAFVTDPQSQPGVVEFGSMQVSGNTVSVPWRVPADGNGNAVAQFVVEYAPKEGGGTPGGGTVANRYDVGQTMVYTFEGLYNTDYEINVRSIDRFGNSSEAVSGSVSIGNFENRPPERTSERMADVSMPDTAETSIVSITLTPYFTDPDLEYGDELSYSATSVNEDIVATEVAGEVLRLIPRAKGTSLVTVTASDLAGATVSFSIYATVAGGTGPSGDDGAVAISPNPVADRLNVRLGDTEGEAAVRIYDGAARLVMEAREEIVGGGVELDVSRLSPGAYSLVAEGGGRTVRGTFVKR